MVVQTRSVPRTTSGRAPLAWPAAMWLFLAGVALVYAPIILDAAKQWIANDNYAHGFFIFPVSIGLLWIRRDRIMDAERRPEAWGLLLVAAGLLGAMGSYLLQIKYIGMWSLIPTLAGGIFALHGRALWRTVQFSVWFLLFAAPIPNSFLGPLTGQIQGISCTGAAMIMSTLGYPVIQHANVLEVPGASLEVATACSGFHKLISLLAFAAIYGHLFLPTLGKRGLLLLLSVPIALLVNVLRICGLVAAAIYGGLPTLHLLHDPAEIVSICLSFVLFVLAGRALGGANVLDGIPAPGGGGAPAQGRQRTPGQETRGQGSAALALACCALVLGVAGLDFAYGPIPVARPRKLAVDTFPARLGAWQGGAIAPVDPEIQARLRTSAVMDREYTNGAGRTADVMLVTASDNLDIHNPKDCFPSQGWKLTNSRDRVIGGQPVTLMNAQLDDQKMTVLYWTTGVYLPPAPRSFLARQALRLRDRIVPRHEAVSLFVRLMVPEGPDADPEITALAGQVLPPVQALVEEKRKPGEQVSSLPVSAPPDASPTDAVPCPDSLKPLTLTLSS